MDWTGMSIVEVRLLGGPLHGAVVHSIRIDGHPTLWRACFMKPGLAAIYRPFPGRGESRVYLFERFAPVMGHPDLN